MIDISKGTYPYLTTSCRMRIYIRSSQTFANFQVVECDVTQYLKSDLDPRATERPYNYGSMISGTSNTYRLVQHGSRMGQFLCLCRLMSFHDQHPVTWCSPGITVMGQLGITSQGEVQIW